MSHFLHDSVVIVHDLPSYPLILSHVRIKFDVGQVFLAGVDWLVKLFHVGEWSYWPGATQIIRHTDDVHRVPFANLTCDRGLSPIVDGAMSRALSVLSPVTLDVGVNASRHKVSFEALSVCWTSTITGFFIRNHFDLNIFYSRWSLRFECLSLRLILIPYRWRLDLK